MHATFVGGLPYLMFGKMIIVESCAQDTLLKFLEYDFAVVVDCELQKI